MRSLSGWWIIILILLLVDFYVFWALRFLTHNNGEKGRAIIYTLHWLISVAAIAFIIAFPHSRFFAAHTVLRNYIFAIVVGLFFAKLVASTLFLLDDTRRFFIWLMAKIFPKTGVDFTSEENIITRSAFLTWTGFILGGGLFTTLLAGFSNKYNYKVRRVKLAFNNLPQSFKGMKILQVSDIHSGSFTNKEAVNRGVDMIVKENADLILFTGDLVNDKASEMQDYIDVFSRLKAPMGVYSTLGNHDYGDYVTWPSPEAKRANHERLKKVHEELGWRLLMNEHVVLERDGEQIALLGIENWSASSRFPKYGRMDLAYPGTEKYSFKILMSHDPSHWDAEVRPKYPDIDLMLSGHTHGMQFGVENPYFKWSPVQYFYKEWAGLYKTGRQMLYVNRGYGFIGYPGRVGILPEITVIELV
ncbi:metallophosphoesterase [Parafilimonas sp.]|uniref:metallophosphoesterase n=1 Tax=Parafilimonas sp. TaxID=1969739 RepID=UPI0039E5B6FD